MYLSSLRSRAPKKLNLKMLPFSLPIAYKIQEFWNSVYKMKKIFKKSNQEGREDRKAALTQFQLFLFQSTAPPSANTESSGCFLAKVIWLCLVHNQSCLVLEKGLVRTGHEISGSLPCYGPTWMKYTEMACHWLLSPLPGIITHLCIM